MNNYIDMKIGILTKSFKILYKSGRETKIHVLSLLTNSINQIALGIASLGEKKYPYNWTKKNERTTNISNKK